MTFCEKEESGYGNYIIGINNTSIQHAQLSRIFFVESIPCVKKFTALSHDGLEIKAKLSTDIFGKDFIDQFDILNTEDFTFVLYNDKLSLLSKKLKRKQQAEVSSLAVDLFENDNTKLVKADNENSWLLYSDHLLQYNYRTKKAGQDNRPYRMATAEHFA